MPKTSLFHIAKRDALPWYQATLIRGCAILLALVVCALVTMLMTGENPFSIYATIFKGAFGTARKKSQASRQGRFTQWMLPASRVWLFCWVFPLRSLRRSKCGSGISAPRGRS